MIWIVRLAIAVCGCGSLFAGDITLKTLSRGNVSETGEPENAAISKAAISQAAFVVYCNDVPTSRLMQSSGARELSDKALLSPTSDITAQAADRLSVTSLVLTAYEQAAHLALRFARAPSPEDTSLGKQVAAIHDVLWRLFLAAKDASSSRPVWDGVDWLMLVNLNPPSFDYSQWRF